VNTSNIQLSQFGTAQPSTPQNPSGNIQFIPQPPQTPQNGSSAIKIDDQNITSFGKKYNTNNTSSVAEEEQIKTYHSIDNRTNHDDTKTLNFDS